MIPCFNTEKKHFEEAYSRVDQKNDKCLPKIVMANKVCCCIGSQILVASPLVYGMSGAPVLFTIGQIWTTVNLLLLRERREGPLNEAAVAGKALFQYYMERPQRIAEIAILEDTSTPIIAAKLTFARVIKNQEGKEKEVPPISLELAAIIAQFAAKTSDKKSALHAGKATYSAAKILGNRSITAPMTTQPIDRCLVADAGKNKKKHT
ncbi:MAG: hypothetical protein V4489_08035 [Chlamydiota bacterium]